MLRVFFIVSLSNKAIDIWLFEETNWETNTFIFVLNNEDKRAAFFRNFWNQLH